MWNIVSPAIAALAQFGAHALDRHLILLDEIDDPNFARDDMEAPSELFAGPGAPTRSLKVEAGS